MIRDDVLVVGGGLAGMTTALAAARSGVDVRVVTHAENTLRSASGLVDVLGYPNPTASTAESADPVVDPFEAIDALPADHPYRIVGDGVIRDALSLFDEVTGDLYCGGHTDRNALLPTFAGTPKPTARYPAATAAGLLADDTDTLLVGFDSLVDFDAPAAAAHLTAAGVPFTVRGVTVHFPGDLRTDAKLTRYVHALDRDEPLPVDGRPEGVPARTALARLVADELAGESRVGFPAILGLDDAVAVRRALEDALDAAVFEVPMGPPSIPGRRLQDAFETALGEHGVAMESGNPAVGYETDANGDLSAVLVDHNGRRRPYHADQFVLATGGLVGKGVDADRESVTEPLFDCPVPHPDERDDWSSPAVFGEHAFARFGVQPDDDLRPVDEHGTPAFENLRAAGSVLGGFDFAAEKSGSGVSLATGYHAGTRAAEAARTRDTHPA